MRDEVTVVMPPAAAHQVLAIRLRVEALLTREVTHRSPAVAKDTQRSPARITWS
jgi:hypothetical protein